MLKRALYIAVAAMLLAVAPSGAGGGVVAVQACEPSCPDASGDRYVDCGNGTVTDNVTGLVWLADATCLGRLDWHEAIEVVGNLADLPTDVCDSMSLSEEVCDCGLSDGSSPGEWRLPTWAEWAEMLDPLCDPRISDDSGLGCWTSACVTAGNCSFQTVHASAWYWTGMTVPGSPEIAIGLNMSGGFDTTGKTADGYIWAVRGGQ